MQRKSFIKLLLKAFGYAMMGNILSLVTTFSILNFSDDSTMNLLLGISSFCSICLYLMMIFSVGYNDGVIDKKLLTRKQIEKPDVKRWIIIGSIVGGFFCLHCLLLYMFTSIAYLNVFRLVFCGTVFSLSLFFENPIPVYAPLIFMSVFIVTPFVCGFGYQFALKSEFSIENIIYKKKK